MRCSREHLIRSRQSAPGDAVDPVKRLLPTEHLAAEKRIDDHPGVIAPHADHEMTKADFQIEGDGSMPSAGFDPLLLPEILPLSPAAAAPVSAATP